MGRLCLQLAPLIGSEGKLLIGMPKLGYRMRHEQRKRLTRNWTAVQEAKARETAE